MEVITVRIEALTFLAQYPGYDSYTEFGFVGEEISIGLARVPELPEISNGSLITVVLRKPGDWQSIIGWLNHSTGEEIVSTAHKHACLLIGVLLGWYPALLGSKSIFEKILVGLFFLGAFIRLVWGVRLRIKAKSILRNAKNSESFQPRKDIPT